MKRIISAALVLLLLAVFLTGCQKKRELYQYDLDEYVTLGAYRGLHVHTDSEEYRSMLTSYAHSVLEDAELTTTKDKATGELVEDGDALSIDFVGKMDGKTFDGGSAQDYALTIGSNAFIPGFEDGLIGKKVGETVDLNLNFPDPYENNTELSGKPVVFTVTINTASKTVYPEVTEEIAKQLDCASLADYQAKAKEAVVAEMLWQQVEDASQILKYPDKELDDYVQDMIDSYSSYAQQYNMTFDQFLSSSGMTEASFREYAAEQLKPSVAREMIYYAIADKEKLALSKDDLETGKTNMASDYGQTVDELEKSYDSAYIERSLMFNKVRNFLLENSAVD